MTNDKKLWAFLAILAIAGISSFGLVHFSKGDAEPSEAVTETLTPDIPEIQVTHGLIDGNDGHQYMVFQSFTVGNLGTTSIDEDAPPVVLHAIGCKACR